MLHPSTPSKADDGIEKIKRSLSQDWGLNLPPRDASWSPSRRDPNRLEDRILARIQFLYFKGGALALAIGDFEKRAITLYSEWRYKPRGESSVLPSREPGDSALRRDFLHRRDPPEEAGIKMLTETLLLCLDQMSERVRSGEKFPSIESKKATEIVSAQATPQSARKPRHQSSIKQWCRSKSEPSASSKDGVVAAGGHHPSSDDFKEDEMSDVFMEMSRREPLSGPAPCESQKDVGTTPTDDEKYETPPTTPPISKKEIVGLGIGLEDRPDQAKRRSPPDLDVDAIKNKKRPYSDSEPMKPPPTRRISREKRSGRNETNYAVPTPPPDSYNFKPRSLSMAHSFDSISVSSSMTSASPAWTSPNTSFCADSLATSFDSTADETDTTVRPLFGQTRQRYTSGQSLQWSVGNDRNLEMKPPFTSNLQDPTASSKSLGIKSKSETSGPPDVDMSGGAMAYTKTQCLTKPSLLANLEKRLFLKTPVVPQGDDIAYIPFRQLYEIIRASSHANLSVPKTEYLLGQNYDSYDDLWTALRQVFKDARAQLPEKSSSVAWDRAEQTCEGVAFSGRMTFSEQLTGPLFDFRLNPLKLESSYRLSRKFGSDRFCVLSLPGLGSEDMPAYLRSDHAAARERIIHWLVSSEHCFLGRRWRAFFTKPITTKKRMKLSRNLLNDARYRIYFFAEDGAGFTPNGHAGEKDPRRPSHQKMTVEQLIQWFMPLKLNQHQPSLKLFARLKLGVSDTIPTVEFKPREIIRCDDARADSPKAWRLNITRSDEKKTHSRASPSQAPVMNDGCSRMSRPAAIAVAHMLGMDHTPSVYQGRIAGAKGIWMVDSLDEKPRLTSRNFWIEINDSQSKFEGHSTDAMYPDEARVKFEVNDYSRLLTPSCLNFQLMLILEARGVPITTFRDRLEEDLTLRVSELKVAMDSSLALRKWNQENNPVSTERARYGGIEMQGGLPHSRAEKVNWFLEHGFDPKLCQYLKQQLWDTILSYCLRLENRMNIGIGRSTYAFMIADPLAILEEDEIHLGFSNSFRDSKSGFDETMLHNIDALVARLPAHLPSDIQKVRAVFKPELRIYRDVVVFSSKGSVSLASKLSGGDYDGDKAWICWDPDIVEPFRNAEVPEFSDLDFYGIEKDNTKVADHLSHPDFINRFLRQAFNFNLQPSMLGPCTNYLEALCYKDKSLDSPQAINIAVLLGNLVDSAKGGFIFDEDKWKAFLKRNDLHAQLKIPAYKDRDKAKPTDHMIDQLVFEVAKKVRVSALSDFDERFREASWWDLDLVCIRNVFQDKAKSDQSLALVLKNLKIDMEEILQFWKNNARPEDENDETRPPRKANALSFRAVVEKCRGDFLALRPRTDDPKPLMTRPSTRATSDIVASEKVRQWQQESEIDTKTGEWPLVKASVAFHLHHKTASVWHIAGIELGEIKATRDGRGSYCVLKNEFHAVSKLDSKLVDGVKRREMERTEDMDEEYDEEGVLGYEPGLLDDVNWEEDMSQF